MAQDLALSSRSIQNTAGGMMSLRMTVGYTVKSLTSNKQKSFSFISTPGLRFHIIIGWIEISN